MFHLSGRATGPAGDFLTPIDLSRDEKTQMGFSYVLWQ
jgi:hypothetical protein